MELTTAHIGVILSAILVVVFAINGKKWWRQLGLKYGLGLYYAIPMIGLIIAAIIYGLLFYKIMTL